MLSHLSSVEEIEFLRLFNQRIDDVDLAAHANLLIEKLVHLAARVFATHSSYYRFPARRHFIDHRQVKIAINAHHQRARNRCSGHHQHIRVVAALDQPRALKHAKAMLLVNNDKTELLKLDRLLDQGVSADHQIDLTALDCGVNLSLARGGQRATQKLNSIGALRKHYHDVCRVLFHEDFLRNRNHHLT